MTTMCRFEELSHQEMMKIEGGYDLLIVGLWVWYKICIILGL